MKICIAGHDLPSRISVSGRPSDLRWFANAILKDVASWDENTSWCSSVIEPDEEREANRAAEQRKWDDIIVSQAEAIKAKREAETLDETTRA